MKNKNIQDLIKQFSNSEKNTQVWVENSPVCTKIVDLDLNLQYMSKAGIEAIGIDDITVFYNKPYPLFIYPQPYRDNWEAAFQKVKDTSLVAKEDVIAITTKGDELWFDSTFIPITDDKGTLEYIIVVSVDITERKIAQENLLRLNRELESTIAERTTELIIRNKQLLKAQEISKMGFWELELNNNRLYWSDEIFKIFEINPSYFEASYEGFLNTIHPDDRDLVREAYSNSLETKEDYVIEHRLLMNDGRIKWVREECHTEFDLDGSPIISLGAVVDITELHLSQQKLLEQTYVDYLTKLNNRKSYSENIEKLLSQYKRYKTSLSIIMYDIDNFKRINDEYGHSIGDVVLVEMSKLIKSHIRDSDYIFRIGGEEFIILLTETCIDKAKIVAEKIRDSVENNLKTIIDEKITISIGLTEAKDDDSEDVIFKRVDELLYKSKKSGKNKVSY